MISLHHPLLLHQQPLQQQPQQQGSCVLAKYLAALVQLCSTQRA
jgi:hypothetical protein